MKSTDQRSKPVRGRTCAVVCHAHDLSSCTKVQKVTRALQWVCSLSAGHLCAARADEAALVKQLSEQCLHLQSAARLAAAEAAVARLECNSYKAALEESNRHLTAAQAKPNPVLDDQVPCLQLHAWVFFHGE